MNLESNGLSVQCYLKPKLMGKMRRRVQEMRNPNAQGSSVDLSHNESTRLAMDALLDKGLDGYQEVLIKENEANFLSAEEKTYILNNIKKPLTDNEEADRDEVMFNSPPVSSETYFPAVTESEPPFLDYGWPVADWSYHLQGIPSVEVFFQSAKSSSMKDLLRELIRQATTVLAIVMDTFSDVEIFCDILEATRKRNVYVYLLLDHTNLQLFQDMCENVKINKSHLTRMSIRSVQGETYCAKSGRKFTGQMKEKFIIVDCTKVLVGSYSLTWLSWQVHRSLAVLFKGSGVKPFDLEFRRLYALSNPVPGYTWQTSNPADLHLPFEKLQIPIWPAGIPRNTADHQQKPRNPGNPSFLTPPVLVRQTSYPSITTGPQRSQWLPRRNTIHHTTACQSPLFKDYNMRSQTWRPIQGNHINRGVPEASHWC
ncbi:protein FAM83A [Megalobrama amblycephala]|uniref:protein FAM83A n=1 Tax=Megalobrama amblycephala TaxID=75352 RepID=UPI002013FE0E|nr:protein FAM83A [Megalobrama amblycephala]